MLHVNGFDILVNFTPGHLLNIGLNFPQNNLTLTCVVLIAPGIYFLAKCLLTCKYLLKKLVKYLVLFITLKSKKAPNSVCLDMLHA